VSQARAHILTRLREAQAAAGARAALTSHGASDGPGSTPALWRDAPAGDLLPRFAREFGALKGELCEAADETAAVAWLRESAREAGWRTLRFAATPGAYAADPAAAALLGRVAAQLGALPLAASDDAGHALAGADVGLSSCDALVAASGSVVLTSRSAAGRALTVLPPVHVVVARRSQIVPTLSEAYALLRARYAGAPGGWPSVLCTITGPSRTADIEKILVMGAHGPKRLLVVVLP